MNQGPIFVVGHRNPDTDSICSALGYAELLRRQGRKEAVAARAGNLNQQTEFVLDYLGVAPPRRLVDVFPRVGDVLTEEPISIAPEDTLARALELYHRHHIRMLPVADRARKPLGLLILKELTELFLLPTEPRDMRRILASPASVARCLQAQIGTLHKADSIEELDLYVGARDDQSFVAWLQGIDPRRCILISGPRPAIIDAAIEAGVRMLILSGDTPLEQEWIDKAHRRNVSLVTSGLDTANCCWRTRLATPISALIGKEFLQVERSELLSDLRLKLLHQDASGAVVVDEEGCLSGIATKSHLLRSSPVKLVLVDHNELSQAVPGAEQVEILEVIDHHRLGNFHTDRPIRFINQPVGSTCTLVSTLYRQAGLAPDPSCAGLLLAGLLSDTVILKSPTTTDTDREICGWLADIAGLDSAEYGRKLFSAGSPMASGMEARKLITTDFKEYEVDGRILGLGQVEVVSFHTFHERKQELDKELGRIREEKGYTLAALLVTDIVAGTSLLLTAGPRELPMMLAYPQQGSNLYLAAGVLSRKKQLVPHLLKIFKGN